MWDEQATSTWQEWTGYANLGRRNAALASLMNIRVVQVEDAVLVGDAEKQWSWRWIRRSSSSCRHWLGLG